MKTRKKCYSAKKIIDNRGKKELLNLKIPIEQIIKATGLTLEEIKKINS